MWGCHRKMLQREGAELAAVIQAVLLFWVETWVLSVPMAQRLEGVHVGFLIQVTKLKEKRPKEGSWQKLAADKVLQGAETQQLQTYLDKRQAIVT